MDRLNEHVEFILIYSGHSTVLVHIYWNAITSSIHVHVFIVQVNTQLHTYTYCNHSEILKYYTVL